MRAHAYVSRKIIFGKVEIMREAKIEEALEILKKRLSAGPQNRLRLVQACAKAGISHGEYREALYRLNVRSFRSKALGGWAVELRSEEEEEP